MTVADFINASEGVFRIALFENEEDVICFTRSDWKGVEPYMGREIDYFEITKELAHNITSNISQVNIHLADRKE